MSLRQYVIVFACLAIISTGVAAGILMVGDYMDVGGSVWQFDYAWDNLYVKGTNPDNQAVIEKTWTAAGVGQSDYHWIHDVDGPFNPNTGAGRLPSVVVQFSKVGRVDSYGNTIPMEYADPFQVAYEVGDKIYYKFYYEFDCFIGTEAVQTVNSAGVPACEYGQVDVYATMQIYLKQSIFNTTIEASYYADAMVAENHIIDYIPSLQSSAYVWWLEPSIAICQDKGSAVDVENLQIAVQPYSADLTLHVILTAGATRAGIGLVGSNEFDMWVVRTVRVCLLLAEPLSVGDQSMIDPFDPPPPPPNPFFDFLTILLLIVIIFVALFFAFILVKLIIWVRKV